MYETQAYRVVIRHIKGLPTSGDINEARIALKKAIASGSPDAALYRKALAKLS